MFYIQICKNTNLFHKLKWPSSKRNLCIVLKFLSLLCKWNVLYWVTHTKNDLVVKMYVKYVGHIGWVYCYLFYYVSSDTCYIYWSLYLKALLFFCFFSLPFNFFSSFLSFPKPFAFWIKALIFIFIFRSPLLSLVGRRVFLCVRITRRIQGTK